MRQRSGAPGLRLTAVELSIAAAHVQPLSLSLDPVKDSVDKPARGEARPERLADPDAPVPTFAHLETWLSLLAHVEQLKTAVAYVS